MEIENLVAVSGMPGVYRIASSRNNGIVVEDLDTGKKKFVAARKHQFTPLATVGIYTLMDTVELEKVFKSMKQKLEEFPPPSPKSSGEELSDYFSTILPEYDRDQVMLSDIRKVIKWFTFLNERNLLESTDEEE